MQRSPFCVLSLADQRAEGSPHPWQRSSRLNHYSVLIWRENYVAYSCFGLFLAGRRCRRGDRMRDVVRRAMTKAPATLNALTMADPLGNPKPDGEPSLWPVPPDAADQAAQMT